MVMGNASGRKEDGEGCSGVKNSDEYSEVCDQSMEFGGEDQQAHGVYQDPMVVHSHGVRTYQPPFVLASQIVMPPLMPQGEAMQVRNPTTAYKSTCYDEEFPVKPTAVMITWSYGGRKVAVTGSWDGWQTIEPLWSIGKDFTVVKLLPSGVYHYRFIVDERLRYTPDSPFELDDSGNGYNVLDVQDYIPEAPECQSQFEAPPSPFSSYDNEPLTGNDFSKAPPDLPPQLQTTLLNQPAASTTVSNQSSLPKPRHTTLNHLYIQNSDGHLPVAISSTCRFRHKYVTVMLYKPSRR